MDDFSTRLKDIMDTKGVTQLWLAEKTNIAEATISRYVSGIHAPRVDYAARIANALNVSVDYIMGLSLEATLSGVPEEDVVILADAYRRADDDRKNIVWAALGSCLTPAEKETVSSKERPDHQ